MGRPMDPFIVVMGVSGCGKTTIAEGLAKALGGTYLEGDSFHTVEAKAMMGKGIPLTDDDRWPWFDRMVRSALPALRSIMDEPRCFPVRHSSRHIATTCSEIL